MIVGADQEPKNRKERFKKKKEKMGHTLLVPLSETALLI